MANMTLQGTIRAWKEESNIDLLFRSMGAYKKAGNGLALKTRNAINLLQRNHAETYERNKIHYRQKVTFAGKHIRVQDYQRPITKGEASTRTNYSKGAEGDKEEKNLYRARMDLVDTINSNVTPYTKFMTLTTAKAVLERPEFMKLYNQFRQNFARRFGFNLRYVAVTERQEKRGEKEGNAGAWHIHVMVFIDKFLPFDDVKACWPYGSVDLKKIDKPENLGRYMAKYLTKQLLAKNEKAVLKSYGLKRPETRYNPFPGSETLATFIERANAQETYTKDYTDKLTGEVITMTEYIIP